MSGYFVADIAALAAVDTSNNPKIRWVDTLKAKYFFVPGSSVGTNGNNILNAADASGQWFRETYQLVDSNPIDVYITPLFVGQMCLVFFAAGPDSVLIDGLYIAGQITGTSSDWSLLS